MSSLLPRVLSVANAGFIGALVSIATASGLLSLDSSAAPVWEQHAGFRSAPLLRASTNQFAGFAELSASRTGVVFTNQLDDQAVLKNQNLMLGSGVAAGDFDGDGWCDLYFCALTGANALFRNRGDWRFDEVTTNAGVALIGNASTGAVFADVDGDGDLDLLVGSLGEGVKFLRNEGAGKFRDATIEADLTSRAGSMTLALGDVEGDGDLDLYVSNYGAQAIVKGGVGFQVAMVNGKTVIQGPYADRLRIINGRLVELGEPPTLYLNAGGGKFTAVNWGTERFRDEDGKPLAAPVDFGLSAQMRDVNGDGAPDIYVCNDFDTPDRFWMNDGRGHFRLLPRLAQRSQSFASMGVDFADIDRDGHLDFFVVEMLAADRARRLWQMNAQAPPPHLPGVIDNRPELSRNTLFHARGDGTFAEIANYAGVAASDWSWQGVFLDVDLDGFEDLLVVNGHLFDVQDLDVPPPRSGSRHDVHAQLLASPRLFTSKRAWRNRGDLTFEDCSARWSFNDTNICHGIALADLDNDGDIDLIGNRMNASAWLLRNEVSAPRIAVRLKGVPPNTSGIGAKITLRGGAVPAQTQEIISGGKYLSGDQTMRVFAAPRNERAGEMTLEVAWRSGARSNVGKVEADRIYEISEAGAAKSPFPTREKLTSPLFTDQSDRLKHVHVDPVFDDSHAQPLLTRKLSQRGPGLCVTDLDGDGHEDLIVGTGRGSSVSFFRGDGKGGFTLAARSQPVPDDILALVEWYPAPGKRGVLCTLANLETARPETPLLWLALEQGELVFNSVIEPSALPSVRAVSFCLAVADFDADDDLDVFMGGHAIAGRYPESAPSLLLRNDGGALRPDQTNLVVLGNVGLVNSALWSDLNNDDWPELVITCEWGPIRVFENERGVLRESTNDRGLASHSGWWTGIAAADFDGNGQIDLVAANWGLNGAERATAAQPLRLYYGDFLGRGTVDLIETEYDGASPEPMPARRLSDMAVALPALRKRYASHRAWAASSARAILAPYKGVREVTASTLATAIFLNRGEQFEFRPLPREAQLAPAWSVSASDFDGDGHQDIFLSQNLFALSPESARLDAGRGLLLRNDGQGGFSSVPGEQSGLKTYGEQRGSAVADFDEDGRPDLIVAQNGNSTSLYRNSRSASGVRVRLAGPPANPRGIGASIRWVTKNQAGTAHEVRSGSGWLSQDSAIAVLLPPAGNEAEIEVRWPGGRKTKTVIVPEAREVQIDTAGKLLNR